MVPPARFTLAAAGSPALVAAMGAVIDVLYEGGPDSRAPSTADAPGGRRGRALQGALVTPPEAVMDLPADGHAIQMGVERVADHPGGSGRAPGSR
jgi:hypothetical protein